MTDQPKDPQKPEPRQQVLDRTGRPVEPELGDVQESDLLVAMIKLRNWWQKYGTVVLVAILVVVSVWTGKRMLDRRALEARNQQLNTLATADDPTVLRALAPQISDPNIQAQAWLKAGGLLLRDADAATRGDDEQDMSLEQREQHRQQRLEEALNAYKAAAGIQGVSHVFKREALFRQAGIYEQLQQWDQAVALYEDLANPTDGIETGQNRLAALHLVQIQRTRKPIIIRDTDGGTSTLGPEMPLIDPSLDDDDQALPIRDGLGLDIDTPSLITPPSLDTTIPDIGAPQPDADAPTSDDDENNTDPAAPLLLD